MQREKLSIEDIDAILHHEMTQRLGYDAKDHMMRVNYLAADGEPNWNANFASESPAPLPVLNAFIEALAHVKRQYDSTMRTKLGCVAPRHRRDLALG